MEVTCLSRSDWAGTFPKSVTGLTATEGMIFTLRNNIYNEELERSLYTGPESFEYGKDNGISAIELRGLAYDDPLFEKALDQMSLQDLMNGILRGEWGWNGFMITDSVKASGYFLPRECAMAGNDQMLGGSFSFLGGPSAKGGSGSAGGSGMTGTFTASYNQGNGNLDLLPDYQFLSADMSGLAGVEGRIYIDVTLDLKSDGTYGLISDFYVLEAGKRAEIGDATGIGLIYKTQAEGAFSDNGDGTVTTAVPDVKIAIISSLLVIPCHASSHYGQVWTTACRRKKSRFLSQKVRSLEASCKSGKMLRASSRNVM